MKPVEFIIPIRTGQGLNGRLHWAERAKRVKAERDVVRLLWPRRENVIRLPVVVRLTRFSPGTRPMDDDNLRGSLKAIRDQIAAELHVDDGDTRSVRWDYDQERGEWGVRVEILPLRTHPAACDDPYCCPMGGATR